MWTITPPFKLLRYLIVLRVNSNLVRLAYCPTGDFSRVLGEIIASRLSTQEARVWHKALKVWHGYTKTDEGTDESPAGQGLNSEQKVEIPDVYWPIDAVLHIYPGKQIYGQDELILCEIKLFEESADHNLFLEILLPALEAASMTDTERWTQNYALWGRFEIESVFVAEGLRWQPFVQQGQIDLTVRPTNMQWSQDLPFKLNEKQQLHKLTWQTPFEFAEEPTQTGRQSPGAAKKSKASALSAPSLVGILNACASRIESYFPGWLGCNQRPAWQEVLEIASRAALVGANLEAPPRRWPGYAIGTQTFSKIAPVAVPYLVLGSLLHVGRYTHLGCGAFFLER
jgi:hypothetical protein